MKLLFITQKLHGQDSFGILWIREFVQQGFVVEVICLEGILRGQEGQKRQEGQEGEVDHSLGFPVYSLWKERAHSKFRSVLRFERLITKLHYDRVFIHMAPVWYVLGFWWWLLKRVPTYLWYTHYKMQLGVRLFGLFGTKFFCATPQSLPQYDGSLKKIVVGHGIDLQFWPKRRNQAMHSHRLLIVHRLSRSKRVELSLRALTLLDASFTIDIYGIEAEKDYGEELRVLVRDLKLESRVTFHGTVPMKDLPAIYTRHRLILNMASETIDKTMLEAMTCGCYPVTTASNAKAVSLRASSDYGRQVGMNEAPKEDSPEAIAAFIRSYAEKAPMEGDEMYKVVEKNHGLEGLMKTMGSYINLGK